MLYLTNRIASVAALALSLLAGPVAAADEALVAAATAEGNVVWYSGMLYDRGVLPVANAFMAKYPGITVDAARHQDNETIMLVQTEARAGRISADVVDGNDAIANLNASGLLGAYIPEAAADFLPANKDPEGHWTAMVLYFLVPAYNTELISEEDAPKSFEDLLDPKWSGKIAWAEGDLMAGPPGFIFSVIKAMGPEKAQDYLKKLAAQKIVTIPASQRVVLDQVIAGEYAIGLQTYNHHSAISGGQGAPIAWVPDFAGLQQTASVGLVKDSPHPNAAKLLVEFILSDEGQEILKDAGYIPASSSVAAGEPSLKPSDKFDPVVGSAQDSAVELPKAVAIYHDLFR